MFSQDQKKCNWKLVRTSCENSKSLAAFAAQLRGGETGVPDGQEQGAGQGLCTVSLTLVMVAVAVMVVVGVGVRVGVGVYVGVGVAS